MANLVVPATGAGLLTDTAEGGNVLPAGGLFFGAGGALTRVTTSAGLPTQFDTVTAARFGSPGDAAAADHATSAGIIAVLKGIFRDLRARFPAALGQATMANSLSVTIASNQSAIPLTGTVDLRVGGAAASGGAGNADASTLRVMPAADAPVPVRGRTTRECNQATGIRVAFATTSGAVALPPLGPSREIKIEVTKPCLYEFGADGSVTAGDDGNAHRLFENDRDFPVVPAGMTHIAILGVEAGVAYIKAVNG